MRWIFDGLDDWDCGDNPLGEYERANAHVHLLTLLSSMKGGRSGGSQDARMRPRRFRTWLAREETRGSPPRGLKARSRASYAPGRYSAQRGAPSQAPREPSLAAKACHGVSPVRGATSAMREETQLQMGEGSLTHVVGRGSI
jgi:hypothetical protein